jgi:DNA-binding beta-propeller fold protein YncE
MLLDQGTVVAGHRVSRVAPRSALGVAYEARAERDGEPVQLVVIPPGWTDPEALDREVAFLASSTAPGILPAGSVRSAPLGIVLLAPWREGPTVPELVAEEGPLPAGRAVAIVEAAAAVLAAAAQAGLERRELPLTSVLVTPGDRVLVTDLGLARASAGTATPREDARALGTLLLVLLAGRVARTDPAVLREERPDLPAGLVAAVAAALAPGAGGGEDVASPEAFLRAVRRAQPPTPAGPEEGPAALRPREREERHAAVLPARERDGEHAGDGHDGERPGGAGDGDDGALPVVAARLGLPRRRSAQLAGLLLLAALLMAPAVAVLVADDAPEPLAESLRVSRQPTDVALLGDTVWVTSGRDDRVVAFDARTAEVVLRPREVGGGPLRVAAGEGSVWTANAEDGTVARIDPLVPGDVGRRIALSADAVDVAVGPGGVWVTNGTRGTVTRIDPVSNRVLGRPVRTGNFPTALTIGAGYVWVVNSGDGTVARIDPREDLVVGRRTPVGRDPQDVAVGLGSVWVANRGDGTITRLDARTGRPQRTLRVGGAPSALAIGRDALLVLDTEAREVLQVDPRSGRVTRAFTLGGYPAALAVGEGAAWVVDARQGLVIRIAGPG